MEVFKEKGMCETHGEFDVKTLKGLGDVKIRLDTCPICKKKQDDTYDERQAALKEKMRADDVNRQRSYYASKTVLPPRFQGCTFGATKFTSDAQREVIEVCKRYAEKFLDIKPKGTSLVFCGKTGAGKTHMAAAIINHLKSVHYEYCILTTVSKMIREIRSSYSNKEISEESMIKKFCQPALLVIDEVGVQFGTDAEKVTLFDVINERYERMLPTILIGNLTLQEFKDFTSERIVDRMKENGGRVLVFDWESAR